MFIEELRNDRTKMADAFSREREQFLQILADKEQLIAEKDQQRQQLQAPREERYRDAEVSP